MSISNILEFLKYFMTHKYYVFIECFKRGLIWRGLVHDLSKFLPSEFPYHMRNYFYMKNGNLIKTNNNYKVYNTGDINLDFAWLLHQKRNKHHWQWWTVPTDEGSLRIFEIPEPYLTEMICDWLGAGKAKGFFSPKDDPYFELRKWFTYSVKNMQLHPNTRNEIEKKIGIK